jgi:hypothetical protein
MNLEIVEIDPDVQVHLAPHNLTIPRATAAIGGALFVAGQGKSAAMITAAALSWASVAASAMAPAPALNPLETIPVEIVLSAGDWDILFASVQSQPRVIPAVRRLLSQQSVIE